MYQFEFDDPVHQAAGAHQAAGVHQAAGAHQAAGVHQAASAAYTTLLLESRSRAAGNYLLGRLAHTRRPNEHLKGNANNISIKPQILTTKFFSSLQTCRLLGCRGRYSTPRFWKISLLGQIMPTQ